MKPCCLSQLTIASWRLYASYADPSKDADTYDYDSYAKALAFRAKILTHGGYISVSEPIANIIKKPNRSFFNADKERS